MAVERNGPVRAVPVASDKISELLPQVERFVDKDAYLITDENRAYRSIGKQFAAHDWVNQSHKEYARGDIHNNTAESFCAILERAKQGGFHSLSKKHLSCRESIKIMGFCSMLKKKPLANLVACSSPLSLKQKNV